MQPFQPGRSKRESKASFYGVVNDATNANSSSVRQSSASPLGITAPTGSGYRSRRRSTRHPNRFGRRSTTFRTVNPPPPKLLEPIRLTANELRSVLVTWADTIQRGSEHNVVTEDFDMVVSMIRAMNVALDEETMGYLRTYWNRFARPMGLTEFIELLELLKGFQADLHEKYKTKSGQDSDMVDAFTAVGGCHDASGNIDIEKMKLVMGVYGLLVDIDGIAAELDTDGNNEIDYGEFEVLLKADRGKEDEGGGELRVIPRASVSEGEASLKGASRTSQELQVALKGLRGQLLDAIAGRTEAQQSLTNAVSASGPHSPLVRQTSSSALATSTGGNVPPTMLKTSGDIIRQHKKKIQVNDFYRRIGYMVLKAQHIEPFLSRAGEIMRNADRRGEPLFATEESIRRHGRQDDAIDTLATRLHTTGHKPVPPGVVALASARRADRLRRQKTSEKRRGSYMFRLQSVDVGGSHRLSSIFDTTGFTAHNPPVEIRPPATISTRPPSIRNPETTARQRRSSVGFAADFNAMDADKWAFSDSELSSGDEQVKPRQYESDDSVYSTSSSQASLDRKIADHTAESSAPTSGSGSTPAGGPVAEPLKHRPSLLRHEDQGDFYNTPKDRKGRPPMLPLGSLSSQSSPIVSPKERAVRPPRGSLRAGAGGPPLERSRHRRLSSADASPTSGSLKPSFPTARRASPKANEQLQQKIDELKSKPRPVVARSVPSNWIGGQTNQLGAGRDSHGSPQRPNTGGRRESASIVSNDTTSSVVKSARRPSSFVPPGKTEARGPPPVPPPLTTKGEKEDVSVTDEYGRVRQVEDAKLYQCYFGQFGRRVRRGPRSEIGQKYQPEVNSDGEVESADDSQSQSPYRHRPDDVPLLVDTPEGIDWVRPESSKPKAKSPRPWR